MGKGCDAPLKAGHLSFTLQAALRNTLRSSSFISFLNMSFRYVWRYDSLCYLKFSLQCAYENTLTFLLERGQNMTADIRFFRPANQELQNDQ